MADTASCTSWWKFGHFIVICGRTSVCASRCGAWRNHLTFQRSVWGLIAPRSFTWLWSRKPAKGLPSISSYLLLSLLICSSASWICCNCLLELCSVRVNFNPEWDCWPTICTRITWVWWFWRAFGSVLYFRWCLQLSWFIIIPGRYTNIIDYSSLASTSGCY